MMRLLLPVLTSILLLGTTVSAQVVQPQYVRPSKGAVISLPTATQNTAEQLTSVFDWTGFGAASSFIKVAQASGSACPCATMPTECSYAFTMSVYESTSKTGPFLSTSSGEGTVTVTGSTSDDGGIPPVVNVTAPYVKFGITTGAFLNGSGVPIVTACTMYITVTPIPFTSRVAVEGISLQPTPEYLVVPVIAGGSDHNPTGSTGNVSLTANRVNNEGVLAVGGGASTPMLPTTSPITVAASPAAATLMFTAIATQYAVVLQNVGTVPVACAAGTSASSVSLTRYSFVLGAGSAAADGTGGSFDVTQLPLAGTVYCIGNGGAGSVSIMPY